MPMLLSKIDQNPQNAIKSIKLAGFSAQVYPKLWSNLTPVMLCIWEHTQTQHIGIQLSLAASQVWYCGRFLGEKKRMYFQSLLQGLGENI